MARSHKLREPMPVGGSAVPEEERFDPGATTLHFKQQPANNAPGEPSGNGYRLDLGAGHKRRPGEISVDVAGSPHVRADLTRDLPFRSDSCGYVRLYHIVEHLSRDRLIPLMNECWRVLKPGGIAEIEHPLFPADIAMADPTHCSFFVRGTWDYFKVGSNHEEHRLLYRIKPWTIIRAERFGYNDILHVTLGRALEPPWEGRDDGRIPCHVCGALRIPADLGGLEDYLPVCGPDTDGCIPAPKPARRRRSTANAAKRNGAKRP